MKHHITKKQWDELTNNQKITLNQSIPKFRLYDTIEIGELHLKQIDKIYENFTIGQMIEFLGDDKNEFYLPVIIPIIPNLWRVKSGNEKIEKKELVDALWETCKYKLTCG